MSPDRRRDDEDDRPHKKAVGRINLERRSVKPEEVVVQENRCEVTQAISDDSELSIVEKKRRASEDALARVLKAEGAKRTARQGPEPEDAVEANMRESFRMAREAAIAEDAERRRKASEDAIKRVRGSQAPKATNSPVAKPIPSVAIRPSVPPSVVTQRNSAVPLARIVEAATRGMMEALENPKKTRDEASRFLKRVIEIIELREGLEARLREVINKKERVSAVITLAIQINQLSETMNRLKDTLLNSLGVDRDGLAELNFNNTTKLRNELTKAGDSIRRMPSNAPVSMGQEAGIDTDYMKPEPELLEEVVKVHRAPREQSRPDRVGRLFEKLDSHLSALTEATGGRVALDAGFALRIISKSERQLVTISQLVGRGAVPGSVKDQWYGVLGENAGMVTRILEKAEALYEPTYKELLMQIDYRSLQNELGIIDNELREVEGGLLQSRSEETSFLETFREKLGGVMKKPETRFRTIGELKSRKIELEQRMAGVRKLMRMHEELSNKAKPQ